MQNLLNFLLHVCSVLNFALYAGLCSQCHLGSYHTLCSGIPQMTPCPQASVSAGTSYGAVCLTPS